VSAQHRTKEGLGVEYVRHKAQWKGLAEMTLKRINVIPGIKEISIPSFQGWGGGLDG